MVCVFLSNLIRKYSTFKLNALFLVFMNNYHLIVFKILVTECAKNILNKIIQTLIVESRWNCIRLENTIHLNKTKLLFKRYFKENCFHSSRKITILKRS